MKWLRIFIISFIVCNYFCNGQLTDNTTVYDSDILFDLTTIPPDIVTIVENNVKEIYVETTTDISDSSQYTEYDSEIEVTTIPTDILDSQNDLHEEEDELFEEENVKDLKQSLSELNNISNDGEIESTTIIPEESKIFLKNVSLESEITDSDNISLKEVVSLSTLHKCMCNSDEVWYQNECRPQNTFVLVLENQSGVFWNVTKFKTSDFHKIQVGGLKCQKNHLKVNLTFDEFYLYPDGHILYDEYNLIFDQNSSCIEHSIDRFGGLTWGAQVCLPPPSVNFCCKRKYCSKRSSRTTRFPMVVVDGTEKTWNFLTKDYFLLKCHPDQILTGSRLGLDVYLIYTAQGVMLKIDFQEVEMLMAQDEFCIQKVRDKETLANYFEARFCVVNVKRKTRELKKQITKTCTENFCIRKCCPPKQHMEYVGCSISNDSAEWIPTIYQNDTLEEDLSNPKFVWEFNPPPCEYFSLDPRAGDKFMLLNNGSLYVDEYKTSIDPVDYCVDKFVDGTSEQTQALVCFPESKPEVTSCQRVQSELYPSLLVISCLFLAATLFVYAAIPELHAKVHGKSLVSHVFSLLVAYLCLVIVQWASNRLSKSFCIIMGLLTQLSFLGAFFWLNVMCFDIWLTLRSMKPMDENGESSRHRFKLYSIYAWGCPSIISIVTIIIQYLPHQYSEDLIRPGLGLRGCWFSDKTALWTYFYGYVLVLIISNIFFFAQVAFILIQAQRANEAILRTSSKQHKERAWLYLKLFVVMGVTWICEVISWQDGTCEPWLFTDIINALQGLFIFLIFICKKNVYKKIREKSGPRINHVKKIVRGTSSFGSSQTSQRTIEMSVRKLSTSNQINGKAPMSVIAEDEGSSSTPSRSSRATTPGTSSTNRTVSSTISLSSNGRQTPVPTITMGRVSSSNSSSQGRSNVQMGRPSTSSHPSSVPVRKLSQIETISARVEKRDDVTIGGPATTVINPR